MNYNRIQNSIPIAGVHNAIDLASLHCTRLPLRLDSILVPLDGTPSAEHALPWALALARRSGATLRLVHVLNVMTSLSDPIELLTQKDVALRRDRLARLRYVVRRIQRLHRVQATATVIERVQIGEALCDAALESDLVVMATRPRRWWNCLVTGGIAQTVSRRVTRPLMLVPGYGFPVDLTGDPLPADIVVPLDGSVEAEDIVATASSLAKLCDARLTLLHVRTVRPLFPPRNAMRYLERLTMSLRESQSVRTVVIDSKGKSTAKAIHSFMQICEGGMLALASRPGTSRGRFLRRGVVDSLMGRLQGPILLQRETIRTTEEVDRTLQTC